MAKISVIGICGNSTFMSVDHFHEKGETLSADSVFSEIGGKGINQAIAAARMGAEVSFLVAVGDDSDAELCKRAADECGISGFFRVKEGYSTASAFILTDKSGENKVTVYRGAALDEKDVDFFKDEIISSDVLLLQNEVPESVNVRAVEIAKEHGVKVVLNPAPARALPKSFEKDVYLVTPNEQESRLLDLQAFSNSIVTLGAEGALVRGKIKVPAISVIPVDTTGAGDTFNGTLAVCLAEKMSLEEATRYAVVASGISVEKERVLSSIPKRDEIERRLKNE